jgi:undecaprenyl-diphosphatase
VAGSAQELPVIAAPAALVGLAVVLRIRPRPVVAAAGLVGGAGVAVATRRVWPVAPRNAAQVRRSHTAVESPPTPKGAGLTVIVNSSAGSPLRADPIEALREALPEVHLLEVGDHLSMDEALDQVRDGSVIGVAGGDGSINAAASVAHQEKKPLFVVPAGTLNHFARDLGVFGIDAAVEALREGHAVAVDVSAIDGKPFLNTASFGTYSDLVDARERLEGRIGKWPAMVVALARMLRNSEPMEVEIDGRRRRLWMVFVGNCEYQPPGFAPAWRERLDDGQLDVRMVDGSQRFARLSLLLAVLTGRLARCRVYDAFTTKELRVKVIGEPLRLARDGETFDGSREFVICKEAEPVAVYAPRPDPDA